MPWKIPARRSTEFRTTFFDGRGATKDLGAAPKPTRGGAARSGRGAPAARPVQRSAFALAREPRPGCAGCFPFSPPRKSTCCLKWQTICGRSAQDLHPLGDHASFLSQKVNFLLDATLGLINVEQNAIIKIFTVAAVLFLPPTVVGTIYGMNFEHHAGTQVGDSAIRSRSS